MEHIDQAGKARLQSDVDNGHQQTVAQHRDADTEQGAENIQAANAFLDAMAHARAGRGRGRTLSIDWNAWQDVGMLAAQVRAANQQYEHTHRPPRPAGRPGMHPVLEEVITDDPVLTVFRTSFRRDRTWLLSEHVVRGGDSLISGTGMLEIARAADRKAASPAGDGAGR